MLKNINKKLDKCPVCNSHKTLEWYSSNANPEKISFTYKFTPEANKTFRVVRCMGCTHVFCNPIPKDIYKNYEDVIDEDYLLHDKTRILSAKEILKTIKKYKSNGKMLDVGCATGDFLITARESGYDTEGLELSKWSSKIARRRGFKIYELTLKELSIKYPEKYDVISLWGVIEHFENPKEEMIYLNKLLKKGGYLVLWTGDVDGLMSKILKRRWWYWQGQHIQYFTHLSLNKLAGYCGFIHLETLKYPQAVTYQQIYSSLGRYRFQKLISIILKPIFIIKSIWYLRLPGEMFWIAKKN